MQKDEGEAQFPDELSKYTVGANRGPLYENPKSADESSSENLEKPPPELPWTRWQKAKRHFRRYWCCYALGLIIFLAILLPIFFVYIIPAIAQDLLNSATITLDSVSVLQPRANSSLVSLEASINIPGPFTVRTDPTTLGVYLPDSNNKSSLIDLDLGSYTVHGNSSIGVTNQHTPYVNYTGWQEFVNNTIFKDITTLGLIGPITGHLGKLVAHLHLDKQISTNGLNQFNGFSINAAQLLAPAESDGTNLLANVTLPNQSVLTLEIGNVTMSILTCDLVIGQAHIENLLIRPGNNTIGLRGVVNTTTINSNLGKILKCEGPAIKNGLLQLSAKVTDIVWGGAQVPYLVQAMGTFPLTTEISLLGLIINTLRGILNGPTASGILGGLNSTGILNETGLQTSALSGLQSRNILSHLIDNEPDLVKSLTRRHLERVL